MNFWLEEIAGQMIQGLLDEKEQIRDIGRVLKETGETSSTIHYHMNIDEDFIPDVLQVYNRRNR